MSDLQKYVRRRKSRDPEFAEDFDSGYEQFKIGVMLKRAREEAGLTQEELAERLRTKKSAIEAGLSLLVQTNTQRQLKKLKGKVSWEGDLTKMRRD